MAITSSRASEARDKLARAGLRTLAVAGVAGLGLLASACGGSPAEGVAQVGTTATTTTGSASNGGDPAAYSACMRKNGVRNFPDPDSEGRLRIISGVRRNGQKTGVDVNSPQFRTAQRACQKLQPKGGRPSAQEQAKEREEALKFSACMRSHGVPKFPDPTFSADGGMQMSIGKNAGVDPRSPKFQAAQKTCGKLFGGGRSTIGPGPGGPDETP